MQRKEGQEGHSGLGFPFFWVGNWKGIEQS